MRMHSLNTILSAFLLLDTCHFNKAATDYKETPNPKLRGSSRKMQSLISPTSTDNYNFFNDPGTNNTDALRVDGGSSIMVEEDNTFMEGDEEQSFFYYSEEDNHDQALYKDNMTMMGDNSSNTEYYDNEVLPLQEQYEDEADEKQFMQYPEEMIPADLETDNEELYENNSGMMKDEYDSHEALPVQEQYEEEVYDEKQFMQYPEEMIPADFEADNEELYDSNSGMMMDEYDSHEALPVQEEQYEDEVYDEKQFMQYPEEMIPADFEAYNEEESYEINSAMMKDEYDSHEALPLQEEQYEEEVYDEKQFMQYPEDMIPADFEADNEEESYEINSAMMKDEYDSYEALPLQEEQYEEEVYDEKQFMYYPEEMIPADLEADNEELYDNNSGMMMDKMQDQLIFP